MTKSTANFFKPVLMLAMLSLTAFKANGQQIKPAEKGYAPVNGIKVYYEVYGEGKPLVLLHGAFYTIELNWAELMDYLKIDSADVAGYSMGGSVAYQFAVQSPKRLNRLVIISSTYKTDGWLPVTRA